MMSYTYNACLKFVFSKNNLVFTLSFFSLFFCM